MNLFDYTDLIDDKPVHIATVTTENKPNLAVASNIRVIAKNKLIISASEMVNTPKNVEKNPNIVITIFNKNWTGLRIFGKAEFYSEGEYYDFCYDEFFIKRPQNLLKGLKLKGAIVVTAEKIEEYK